MSTDLIEQNGTEIVTREPRDSSVMPGFNSASGWELAQRVAKAFASSTMVPASYQGNVANCLIALEMANRLGASPLLVMTNLYVVHGNPGWSSKFLIASFNQCGRFSSLRYEWNADRSECRAWAIEKATGERIDGPKVSLQMAKDEGWSSKQGSKWKTMPEVMMMYRAAAFLIRTYAPEISMGLQTEDELIDIAPPVQQQAPTGLAAVRAAAAAKALEVSPPAVPFVAARTLAQYRADIDKASSAETAALVLDESRDVLDATDQAALAEHFNARWKDAA